MAKLQSLCCHEVDIFVVVSFQRGPMVKPVFYDYQKKKINSENNWLLFSQNCEHFNDYIFVNIYRSLAAKQLERHCRFPLGRKWHHRPGVLQSWGWRVQCLRLSGHPRRTRTFACGFNIYHNRKVQFPRTMDFGPLKIKRYAAKTYKQICDKMKPLAKNHPN